MQARDVARIAAHARARGNIMWPAHPADVTKPSHATKQSRQVLFPVCYLVFTAEPAGCVSYGYP
jgi:DNA repair protein RadC